MQNFSLLTAVQQFILYLSDNFIFSVAATILLFSW